MSDEGKVMVVDSRAKILGRWQVVTTYGSIHGRGLLKDRGVFDFGKFPGVWAGVVAGNDGSNRFKAEFSVGGKAFACGRMVETTCAPSLDRLHNQVIDALMVADEWEVAGGALFLTRCGFCVLSAVRLSE